MNILRTPSKLLFLLLLSSCVDRDPFGLANKNILGDYYLNKWEDGKTFYLHDSKKAYEEFHDHGPIGGTVIEIGWNKNSIIAKRKAHFGGKIDGWMVIDTNNKKISGPFIWADIIKNDAFENIEVMSSIQAWEKL